MRKHLTYANVAATLALVFAMSGGALAAKHYLINSTKQINPKVLKKLRGAKGTTGASRPRRARQGAPARRAPRQRKAPTGHEQRSTSAFNDRDFVDTNSTECDATAVAVPPGAMS